MARPPVDDFAKYLVQLRKARKLSARALSQRLGLSEAYIYRWEHEPCNVSRTVLEKVTCTLNASPNERKELFRLADLREAPDSAKPLYTKSADWRVILMEALLEVEYESLFSNVPDDATMERESSRFVLAAGSTLSAIVAQAALFDHLPKLATPYHRALKAASEAVGSVFSPYKKIIWPKALSTIGAVPKRHDDDALEIPSHLIAPQEAEQFATIAKQPRDQHHHVAMTMARIYREMLFSDPERTRQVVSLIKRWTLARPSDGVVRTSMSFRDSDINDVYGIEFVTWERVYNCRERELAMRIWTSLAQSNDWSTTYLDGDWVAFMTAVWAITGVIPQISYPDRDSKIVDAMFTIQSPVWPQIKDSIKRGFPKPSSSAFGFLANSKKGQRLGDEFFAALRSEPWALAWFSTDMITEALTQVARGVRLPDRKNDFRDPEAQPSTVIREIPGFVDIATDTPKDRTTRKPKGK